MQRNLLKEVFDKAILNGADDNGNSIAMEIHRMLDETENPAISADAIRGYYRRYKNNESFNIAKNSKDQLARYLGFKNYREYVQKNKRNGNSVLNYLLGVLIVALGISLFWNFFGNEEQRCMIWLEDHYEETECLGRRLERSFNRDLFEKMRMVEVCKDSDIEKNGKPILWYDRTDNEVTFFTYLDFHPVNGKTLKQATRYMVEKYGDDCE